MSVRPTSFALDVYLNGSWVDLLPYHIAPIKGRDGMGSGKFIDRVASRGTQSFKINNGGGEFTIGGASAMAGWQKDVPIKLDVEYDGEVINVFTARIEDIEGKSKLPLLLDIQCVDWMASTSKFPVTNQILMANLRADEAIRILVDALPWQPAQRKFSIGANVFPTVFDDIGSKGTPAGEINKLVTSELGHLYLRRDDTLVFEAAGNRARLAPVQIADEYPLADDFSDLLIWEDGDTALWEDGDTALLNQTQAATFANSADLIPLVSELCDEVIWEDGDTALCESGDTMIWNDTEEALFDNEALDMDVLVGPNHFNHASLTSYPRYVDASPVRLYRLGSPIQLPANKPVTLKGGWTNPNSGDSIGATSVDTPAATTNYLANSKSDGSGTNRTAQLVIDSFEKDANEFKAVIRSPAGGWLTKWELNGLGIYLNDQAKTELENADSVSTHGQERITVDQKYLNDFSVSSMEVAAELLFQRDPVEQGTRIYMLANKSSRQMMAFLYLQTGNLVHIINDRRAIDNFFYIYDRDYVISPAGIIGYSWGIRQVPGQSDITEIEMEFNISASVVQEMLALGVLPSWASRKITFFCEIFVTSVGTAATLMNLPFLAGGQETFLRFQVNSAGALLARTSQFATAGTWSSNGAVSTGAWVPVAVTYDSESLANAPKFYINGALQTNASATQPTGARQSEPITFLEIGGHLAEQTSTSYDLRIRRHRWFNDVLTAAEILTLSMSPRDFSLFSDRLLMGGFGVPNRYYSDWLDMSLDDNVKVVDMVMSSVGVVISGAPTVRAIT